jgi:hypothetical protein
MVGNSTMTEENQSKFNSLPLDASVKRRALGIWLKILVLLKDVTKTINDRLRCHISGVRALLRYPDGSLVSQTEYPEHPEKPWRVVSSNSDDYQLARPDGKPIDRGGHSECDCRECRAAGVPVIYVYPQHVHPLPDQEQGP